MDTFIRVAEVWAPNTDHSLLELVGGRYDAAPGFGHLSRKMCFGRGEGLPGRAWECGHPLALPRLDPGVFRRTSAAHEAGLDSAVALPFFKDEQLTSVVTLLCTKDPKGAGAIELWHNDPRVTGDLRLADGVFSAQAGPIEADARDGFLPRGAGLPGLAWQRESAVFVEDLVASKQFLRAQAAATSGIVRGLALPCTVRGPHVWIANFLSSAQAPVARRVESWIATDDGTAFQRAFGHCERQGALPTRVWHPQADPAPGPGVARAFATGTVQIIEHLSDGGEAPGAEAHAAGLLTQLALPVLAGGTVSEVIALYF